MVKKILAGFGLLIAAVIIHVGFIAKNSFFIAREIKIEAPTSVIFPMVNNPKIYASWNPWIKQDPNIKLSFEGPQEGVGAVGIYEGNDHAGEGKMRITEVEPANMIRYRMDMEKPMKTTFDELFTFNSDGHQTTVNWTMNGPSSFMMRFMVTYMGMEKQIGTEMSAGLNDLKSIAEKEVTKISDAKEAAGK